jgi:hypothetical protein
MIRPAKRSPIGVTIVMTVLLNPLSVNLSHGDDQDWTRLASDHNTKTLPDSLSVLTMQLLGIGSDYASATVGTQYSVGQNGQLGFGLPSIVELPTRGTVDLTALQPGVAQRGYSNPICLRGSTEDQLEYFVDGVSLQDPFTNRSIAFANNNSLQSATLRSGSFEVDRGSVMSGLTLTDMRSGGGYLNGAIETLTDNLDGGDLGFHLFSMAAHGSIDPGSRLTYSGDFERNTSGERNPGGPNPWNWRWNWRANLRWTPDSRFALAAGTIGNERDRHWIPPAYYYDATHAPRSIDKHHSVWGRVQFKPHERVWTQTELRWFSAESESGDGVYFDDLLAYGRPNGNPRNDEEDLFRSWDDLNLDADSQAVGVLIPLHTETMFESRQVELPDGTTIERDFVASGDESHVHDDYFTRENSYIGGRFDLSIHPMRGNEVLAGAELKRHTVRMYQHYFPTQIYLGTNGGFDDANRYGYDLLGNPIDDENVLNGLKHPVDLALYLQDEFRWDDLTIRGGVRLDRFDYDSYVFRDPDHPFDPNGYLDPEITPEPTMDELIDGQTLTESDLNEAEPHTRLSPRVSAGLAAGENTYLHSSFGRYVQRPAFENLLVDYEFLEYKIRTGGYSVAFGNPASEPQETWSLEAGIRQRLTGNATASVTAFSKDISNIPMLDAQPVEPNTFAQYQIYGEAIAHGLETQVRWQPTSSFAAILNYTVQEATGTASPLPIRRNIAWTAYQPPTSSDAPIAHDQTHRLVAIADLRSIEDGPAVGDWHPFAHSGISALVTAGSGFPYTPVTVYNAISLGALSPNATGDINTERTPAYYRVDLKAYKEIRMDNVGLEIYLWVLNLLDRDNALYVFEGSGSADETGWLDTPSGQEFSDAHSPIDDASLLNGEQKYRLREGLEPNYDIGREIRFGARILF